jgi:hypothetical protein
MTSGDTQAFAQILAKDAVLYSDGGGKRAAALNPIRGAHRILRFFAGVARKDPALAAMAARPATVNGLRASYCAKAMVLSIRWPSNTVRAVSSQST